MGWTDIRSGLAACYDFKQSNQPAKGGTLKSDCGGTCANFQSSPWHTGFLIQTAAVLSFLLSGSVQAADSATAKALVVNLGSACHGLDGNSTDPKLPKLAGRHPEYLVRELKEFVSGARKSDIMTPIAKTLDPDEFKGLGEYFGAQKPGSGVVLDQKMAASGMKLYQDGDEERGVPACSGCHSSTGAGSKRFPRLAGQHKEYLIQQMQDFRSDARSGAGSRLMREVTKRLSDDEIKAVAEYLTGL